MFQRDLFNALGLKIIQTCRFNKINQMKFTGLRSQESSSSKFMNDGEVIGVSWMCRYLGHIVRGSGLKCH